MTWSTRRVWKALAIAWLASTPAITLAGEPTAPFARLDLQPGTAVTVDGLVGSGEWDDAAEARLRVDDSWPVVVRAKRQGTTRTRGMARAPAHPRRRDGARTTSRSVTQRSSRWR